MSTTGPKALPTGAVVGDTDAQTLSAKVLDNTNAITVKDANFTVQDDGDATKQAKFQASGITAGQTRTYTLPDGSGTIALTSDITREIIEDLLASTFLGDGTYVTVTYSDAGNSYTVALTVEAVQDMIATFLAAGNGIGIAYNDAGNALTISAPPSYVPLQTQSLSLTNLAAGDTEFASAFGNRRTRVDLTNASQVRVVAFVTTAGAAGSDIRPQYSTDQSAWSDMGAATCEASLAATGVNDSGWVNLAAGAKADVYVRCTTKDGDGVADPVVTMLALEFR